MPFVPDSPSNVSPELLAALLLAAASELARLGLPHPSPVEILEATAAGRSRAYELKERLLESLPSLARPRGRPASEPRPPVDSSALTREVLRFLMQHPGAVSGAGERQRYSDDFRLFVLELFERYPDLEMAAFAEAVEVPLGTLKVWVSVKPCGDRADSSADRARSPAEEARDLQIQTVLTAWKNWKGPFSPFCDHVRYHLRIPFGRSFISSILEAHGVRNVRRRGGRSPDERALRGAFETFFPGAQWVGDGTSIAIELDGVVFTFNLELLVDADTDSFVGASLRLQEDSEAVCEAFTDGIGTTGAPPLALLLDNKECNLTARVDSALGATLHLSATLGRPQNKAHIEGGFGLFRQATPSLVFKSTSPQGLAAQILKAIVQTWARTLNHKPRSARGDRSRVQLYREKIPTPAEIARARATLEERLRQLRLARQSLEARLNPESRLVLDGAFSRLGLADPEGNIRAAIARYPLDAILAGIAVFEGKSLVGSLPEDAAGRYLLGIVRNIAEQDEGLAIAEALLRLRLEVHDAALSALSRARDATREQTKEPARVVSTFVDAALDTDRRLDRIFWLQAAAGTIRSEPRPSQESLYRSAVRRIQGTHRLLYRDRLAAARALSTYVVPIV